MVYSKLLPSFHIVPYVFPLLTINIPILYACFGLFKVYLKVKCLHIYVSWNAILCGEEEYCNKRETKKIYL